MQTFIGKHIDFSSSVLVPVGPWHKSAVHCTESHMPFELFANENCKLQNEAKVNATFERGSAGDPQRSPLSAELNDASA